MYDVGCFFSGFDDCCFRGLGLDLGEQRYLSRLCILPVGFLIVKGLVV